MRIVPTYVVTWTQPVGTHTHEARLRVPQSDLAAFVRVLLFNGCTAFSAELDT